MARIRSIKAELFTDEKITDLPIEARYLFIGLLPHCDDMGRQRYSPKTTRAQVFPVDGDISDQQVAAWMHQLEDVDLIRIYEDDGTKYFWIPAFTRHQFPDKPTHSYLPPHPKDRRPDCRCLKCKAQQADRNGRRNRVPAGTRSGVVESESQGVVESTNPRLPDSPRNGLVGLGRLGISQSQKQNQNLEDFSIFEPPLKPVSSPDSSREERRLERAALDEFAIRILRTLDVEPNPNILEILTRTIAVRAKVTSTTIELAGMRLGGRAVTVRNESPPDNWQDWLEDARYDYVNKEDKPSMYNRPTCGSPDCEGGWERYFISGQARLRRCKACLQLRQDRGDSSS